MKELKSIEPIKDNIIIAAEKREEKYLGSLELKRGHIMFEIDPKNDTVRQAEYKEEAIGLDGKIKRKLVVKEGCIYEPALNAKNAIKHIIKRIKHRYK